MIRLLVIGSALVATAESASAERFEASGKVSGRAPDGWFSTEPPEDIAASWKEGVGARALMAYQAPESCGFMMIFEIDRPATALELIDTYSGTSETIEQLEVDGQSLVRARLPDFTGNGVATKQTMVFLPHPSRTKFVTYIVKAECLAEHNAAIERSIRSLRDGEPEASPPVQPPALEEARGSRLWDDVGDLIMGAAAIGLIAVLILLWRRGSWPN